jgi:hypothetical protein
MSANTSQNLESYVPVYDVVPQNWEDARQFLVEHLKKISNAVNIREIGWYLDEELVSGKQFIPGTIDNQQFRTIFRKVVDFSPLVIGVNSKPHGITINASFRLINLYGAVSDTVALTGGPINQPNITYDATNINITAAAAFQFSQAVIEYISEI